MIRTELIQARRNKDLTQRQVAEAIGVVQSYISEIENGYRTPSAKIIKKLELLYDTPAEELFADIYKNIDKPKVRV